MAADNVVLPDCSRKRHNRLLSSGEISPLNPSAPCKQPPGWESAPTANITVWNKVEKDHSPPGLSVNINSGMLFGNFPPPCHTVSCIRKLCPPHPAGSRCVSVQTCSAPSPSWLLLYNDKTCRAQAIVSEACCRERPAPLCVTPS